MKKVTKYPKNQIEKFSTVFMHLGLVLVLVVVYLVLEHETAQKKPLAFTGASIPEEVLTVPIPIIYKKSPKKVVQEQSVSKNIKVETVPIDQFVSTDENNLLEDPIPTPAIDENALSDFPEPEFIDSNDDPDPVLMMHLQKAPIYPGCEGLTEPQSRQCLERKIKAHVRQHFDAAIAQEVGMRSGTYRIITQFVIDTHGEIIDLQIRAPHLQLNKEATKVIEKLPKFIPGIQNDKPVKVRYSLPITFKVE